MVIDEFKEKLKEKKEIYLRIKAAPGAQKSEIKEIMADNTIKIDVAALPVKGRANQELIKFLAKEFEVNKNNVKIINGAQSKLKLIKIYFILLLLWLASGCF